MSLDALREGVDWQFDDFSSYLDFLTKRGVKLGSGICKGQSQIIPLVSLKRPASGSLLNAR